MVALGLLLLGITLVYTGVLTAEREAFTGLAIAVMGAAMCAKPIVDFFRRTPSQPLRREKVLPFQKRVRRKKGRSLHAESENHPTIH
ncbi:MAG: hypothetical protein GX443_14325 [Deltaproteobacteria bacterium]|nr:hypothetical protein [Deltaproteobacteria bacterium]